MDSWFVHFTTFWMASVEALAGDIVLCSWARRTLTVPLSTQVYKLVPAHLTLGVSLQWTSIPSVGKCLCKMQELLTYLTSSKRPLLRLLPTFVSLPNKLIISEENLISVVYNKNTV